MESEVYTPGLHRAKDGVDFKEEDKGRSAPYLEAKKKKEKKSPFEKATKTKSKKKPEFLEEKKK